MSDGEKAIITLKEDMNEQTSGKTASRDGQQVDIASYKHQGIKRSASSPDLWYAVHRVWAGVGVARPVTSGPIGGHWRVPK
jgi:hypothetical protein